MAFVAKYRDPFVSPFYEFAALGLPFILPADIVMMIIWAVTRKWFGAITMLLCFLLNFGNGPAHFRVGKHDPDKENGINIMTYNLKMYGGKANYDKAEAISDVLRNEFVDIACFQEYDPGPNNELNAIFKDDLPYVISVGESSILSRFPILHVDSVAFENSNRIMLYADIDVNGKIIRVMNSHFESTGVGTSSHNLADYGYFSLSSFYNSFKRSLCLRSIQINKVTERVKESPYPVILCCDMNDIPASYQYRQVSKVLQDGFMQGGSGFGITYYGVKKLLRIDYIFYDKSLKGNALWEIGNFFSDHRPVMVSLTL